MVLALCRGPISVAGHYFGIHFLALASALTLVGFNVMHFGLLAKLVALRSQPLHVSRLARWVVSHFSLEVTLLVGGVLIFLGFATDAWLLSEWLSSHGASMESSVHAGFVATLAIVLGVNLILGAFLLHMLISEQRE
jgi:hypothetical protein